MNPHIIKQIVTAYLDGREASLRGAARETTPMDSANRGTFLAWDQGWEDEHNSVAAKTHSRDNTALVSSLMGQKFETDLTPNKARECLLQANEEAFRRGFETCAAYLGASKAEIKSLEALADPQNLNWDDSAYAWAMTVRQRINQISPMNSPPKIIKEKDFFRF